MPVRIFCVVDFPEPLGQKAENLPVLHREVQAVKGLFALAVGEGQVSYFNHWPSPHFPRWFFSRRRWLHHCMNLSFTGMESSTTATITSHQYH